MKFCYLALSVLLAIASNSHAALITAAATGTATDDPRNGVFDTLTPPDQDLNAVLTSTREQRGLVEFALPVLPTGAVITSATLKLTDLFDDDDDIRLLGYTGNGTLELADATAATSPLLSLDITNGADDTSTFDVTAFIASLYASGAANAGFRTQDMSEEPPGSGYSVVGGTESGSQGPELEIEFLAAAVPEPASMISLGLGLLGLAGYSWRRRGQAAS